MQATVKHVEGKCQNQQLNMYAAFVSTFPLRVLPPSLCVSHTVFTFAYTQNQIRGPNCYHMVTIVRPENRGENSSDYRKFEAKPK